MPSTQSNAPPLFDLRHLETAGDVYDQSWLSTLKLNALYYFVGKPCSLIKFLNDPQAADNLKVRVPSATGQMDTPTIMDALNRVRNLCTNSWEVYYEIGRILLTAVKEAIMKFDQYLQDGRLTKGQADEYIQDKEQKQLQIMKVLDEEMAYYRERYPNAKLQQEVTHGLPVCKKYYQLLAFIKSTTPPPDVMEVSFNDDGVANLFLDWLGGLDTQFRSRAPKPLEINTAQYEIFFKPCFTRPNPKTLYLGDGNVRDIQESDGQHRLLISTKFSHREGKDVWVDQEDWLGMGNIKNRDTWIQHMVAHNLFKAADTWLSEPYRHLKVTELRYGTLMDLDSEFLNIVSDQGTDVSLPVDQFKYLIGALTGRQPVIETGGGIEQADQIAARTGEAFIDPNATRSVPVPVAQGGDTGVIERIDAQEQDEDPLVAAPKTSDEKEKGEASSDGMVMAGLLAVLALVAWNR